jgi:hypothetical protein
MPAPHGHGLSREERARAPVAPSENGGLECQPHTIGTEIVTSGAKAPRRLRSVLRPD